MVAVVAGPAAMSVAQTEERTRAEKKGKPQAFKKAKKQAPPVSAGAESPQSGAPKTAGNKKAKKQTPPVSAGAESPRSGVPKNSGNKKARHEDAARLAEQPAAPAQQQSTEPNPEQKQTGDQPRQSEN